jgi:hypothetical protein
MSGEGAALTRLLDPASTAAVVLGAHDWTDAGLGRAPSFLRSARSVVAYLYDPAGLALDPELVHDLFDDTAGAGDQLARMRDTLDVQLRERRDNGRPVTDVLVYYIGHGQTDDQGQLSLLVRRSRRGMETETGIKASDLARALSRAAPQQRRCVIIDCCFSEAAARGFIGMAADLNQTVAATVLKDLRDDQAERGTLLLCSSPVGEVSMGAPNAERTLFTGAVLEVLRKGLEGQPQYLSFADLRDAAFFRMVRTFGANAPRPILHQVNAAKGDLTRVAAFPNYARTGPNAAVLTQGPPLPKSTLLSTSRSEHTDPLASEKTNNRRLVPSETRGSLESLSGLAVNQASLVGQLSPPAPERHVTPTRRSIWAERAPVLLSTLAWVLVSFWLVRKAWIQESATSTPTSNFVVTLACAFFVVMHAAHRYDTPETYRFSTTPTEFHLTRAGYVAALLAIFFLLSGVILKPGALPFLGLEDVINTIAAYSAPPVLAALLLTAILPDTPVFSAGDAWLLKYFRSLGRIALGVRNLKGTLTPSALDLSDADVEELRNWILNDGDVPRELANSLSADKSETPRGGFSRVLMLYLELQKLEASLAYVKSFRTHQDQWQAIQAEFRVFIAQSQAFFVLFDRLDRVGGGAEEHARKNAMKSYRETCLNMHRNTVAFLVRLLVIVEGSDLLIVDRLRSIGFKASGPYQAMPIGRSSFLGAIMISAILGIVSVVSPAGPRLLLPAYSSTSGFVVTLVCALVVLMHAAHRYDTPETNRFSTTRMLFQTTRAGYVAASLALFFLLSQFVLMPRVLPVPGFDAIKESIAQYSAPPVLAALLITAILPYFPVINASDAWLLRFFQSLGSIPFGVHNLAGSLTLSALQFGEADVKQLQNWILDDSDTPRELASFVSADRYETVRGGFSRVLWLYLELQKLQASPTYRVSFRSRQDAWDAIQQDFRVFIAQSQAFFVFFDQLNVEGAAGENALATAKKSYREICLNMYRHTAEFLAQLLVIVEGSDHRIGNRLRSMGFSAPTNSYLSMEVGPLLSMAAMVIFTLLGVVSVMPTPVGPLPLAVIAILIGTTWIVAILAAFLPKLRSRAYRQDHGRNLPYAAWLGWAGVAAIVSLLIERTVLAMVYQTALAVFNFTDYPLSPIAPMSFVSCFSIAVLCDVDLGVAQGWARRFTEGLLCGGAMIFAFFICTHLLDIPSGMKGEVPLWLPPVCAFSLGFTSGFFVPYVYRRAAPTEFLAGAPSVELRSP